MIESPAMKQQSALPCLLLALVLTPTACATQITPLKPRTAATPEIHQLEVGTGTNAFVIMGARPILVDTGWGKSTEKVERALRECGVALRDLALIVLTH